LGKHAAHTSRPSNSKPREFATSVVVGFTPSSPKIPSCLPLLSLPCLKLISCTVPFRWRHGSDYEPSLPAVCPRIASVSMCELYSFDSANRTPLSPELFLGSSFQSSLRSANCTVTIPLYLHSIQHPLHFKPFSKSPSWIRRCLRTGYLRVCIDGPSSRSCGESVS
jgi:hypothetical protein